VPEDIYVSRRASNRPLTGTGEGEEDVWISDYKVWTETAKGEECNERSVREVGAYSCFIFVSLYCVSCLFVALLMN